MNKTNESFSIRKYRLWKDIMVVLTIKAILFFFLWLAFFSNPASNTINTNQIYVNHLLSKES